MDLKEDNEELIRKQSKRKKYTHFNFFSIIVVNKVKFY